MTEEEMVKEVLGEYEALYAAIKSWYDGALLQNLLLFMTNRWAMKRRKTSTERARHYGEKLDALFKSILPPQSKKEYTLEHVADVLKQRGTPVSMSHIAKIRRGEVDDPSVGTLQALSDFFGVDFTYWTSPSTTISPSAIEASRVARIQRQVAQGDYTPEQLQFIETMLASLPPTGTTSEADQPES